MPRTREHTLEKTVGDIPLSITADVWPGAPETRTDPADPGEVDITAVIALFEDDNIQVRVDLYDLLEATGGLAGLTELVEEDFFDRDAESRLPPEEERL